MADTTSYPSIKELHANEQNLKIVTVLTRSNDKPGNARERKGHKMDARPPCSTSLI
jgi:hypothetical protein